MFHQVAKLNDILFHQLSWELTLTIEMYPLENDVSFYLKEAVELFQYSTGKNTYTHISIRVPEYWGCTVNHAYWYRSLCKRMVTVSDSIRVAFV